MRTSVTSIASALLMASCGAPRPTPSTPNACPPCECQQGPAPVLASPPPQPPATIVVATGDTDAPRVTDRTDAGGSVALVDAVGPAWSMFHGGPDRAGRSSAPAVRTPIVRWRATVGIQGYLNGPVVSGSSVFVPSSGNTHNAADPRDGVYALDLVSGRQLWHAHFDRDANGLAVVGQRVIATCDDGYAYGLDAQRGTVVWKQKGKGKMYTHPLVTGELVVVGDADGYVRAFAWSDGTPRWNLQMNGAIRGGTASDGSTVYAVSQGGEVAAIRMDGTIKWKKTITRPAFSGGRDVPIEGYAAPVIAGNRLVVPFARDTTYDDPAFVALDTSNGAVAWRARDNRPDDWGNVRTTPALIDGVLVYAEPYSGDVAGIDAQTGRMRYRQTVGTCFFPSYASPAAAGELVYVPRFDGMLYAVEGSTGRVVWRVYLGDKAHAGRIPRTGGAGRGCSWEMSSGAALYAPVAVAGDGTIIVGNGEDTVFAIADR